MPHSQNISHLVCLSHGTSAQPAPDLSSRHPRSIRTGYSSQTCQSHELCCPHPKASSNIISRSVLSLNLMPETFISNETDATRQQHMRQSSRHTAVSKRLCMALPLKKKYKFALLNSLGVVSYYTERKLCIYLLGLTIHATWCKCRGQGSGAG